MSKNVIITGTSRGIGLELAILFANAGHKVLSLSRNQQPVKAIKHPNITCFTFDICNENDIKKVSGFIKNEWKKADILINNAGKLLNKPFENITLEEMEEVYKVNVLGVAQVIKAAIPFMEKGGHVVNISSMGGVQGSVKFPGLSAYSSSKGALITLTELLAEEYKETGPSFNVLALGAVQTEMLSEAFPGYKAPLTALEMAKYIFDFALTGNKYYNGKLLQVSSSTP
ncbi:SDR family NAD(P)-dependent oxidoreductase [Abyssalbus ytuae]|uniref:SDR family oxidoreductase n=1 Tax=Abyssalbus ytuae TaxID=2926907 RepID=A0A9E7CTR4_9FLAO|nr:SDR family oxidoreductase [Abyssalbus ytuae]UOB18521.1 SDR family oxidoreductase [Abyssalbus ytuae]